MAMYKLHYGTQAAYDAKKQASTLVQDDLYFTSDTALIYKGDKLLSAAVEAVDDFPATGAQGRIYVKTDNLEAKVWNGSAWVTVSPAVETTLDQDTATGALVTAGAIRAYIENQIGTAAVVADVTYDSASQKITISYADDTPDKEILLTNLVTDVSYDAASGNFTFTKANGDAKVVNTPVENFLSTAEYDPVTHILTLALENGTEVEANLEDLVVTLTGTDTSSVDITISGAEISAAVKLSANEGNAITIEDDGLFLSLADYYNKAQTDAAIKVVDDKVVALDTRVTAAEGEIDALQAAVGAIDLTQYYTKTEVNELLSWQEI